MLTALAEGSHNNNVTSTIDWLTAFWQRAVGTAAGGRKRSRQPSDREHGDVVELFRAADMRLEGFGNIFQHFFG